MKRTSYHTSVKLLYNMNLLPDEIAEKIPRSTLHRFRNTDYSDIFGIEFADTLKQNEELIKELSECRTALTVLKGIILIKNTLLRIKDKSLSEFGRIKEIVSTVNKLKDPMGLDMVLEYFNISRSTFYSWKFLVNHNCFDSYTGRCLRRWPNQIPIVSIEKIKELCLSEEFKGWPVVSIAHYARRNGVLDLSIDTWYKYTKLAGISLKIPRCIKKRKTGIRAALPHQYWHAEVSIFTTMDNVKSYIYFVIDNYSRAILSWRVSLKLSAETRLETIREAYNRYIVDSMPDVQLTVDGGSENNNSTVDEYINSAGISIKKIIAQKDIIFSNSIVEAVNKIVKYRSLFLSEIADINALHKHLEQFVPVYNEKRPHCSLKGLTPFEVLSGLFPGNREHLASVNLKYRKRSAKEHDVIKCTVCNKNVMTE